MCTITWIMENSGYKIYFNRDELRSRIHAEDPVLETRNGISAIYPVDPEGTGSWIFTNDRGLSGALLNYNIKLPFKNFLSRGTLITDICFKKSLLAMSDEITHKDLTFFRGFTLCLFESADEPYIYRWNGRKLLKLPSVQPIVSSSVKINKVKLNRSELFRKMISKTGDTNKTHRDFHSSHLPEKSFLSTCMHRADSETVSFSQIICNRKKVEFIYQGKSPCMKADKVRISLIRKEKRGNNGNTEK